MHAREPFSSIPAAKANNLLATAHNNLQFVYVNSDDIGTLAHASDLKFWREMCVHDLYKHYL